MIIDYDECPVCKSKNIEIEYKEYNVPNTGKVLLYHFLCLDCYFKTSEIIPIEENKEIKIIIEINNENDLKKKIYKSEFSDIYLKEIDLEIWGINSEGLILTIEGLLEKIIDKLEETKILFENKEKIDEKINYIRDVLNNKKKLTIIIEDKKGLSKLLSI